MSSSEAGASGTGAKAGAARAARRDVLRALAVTALAAGVAACENGAGFKPLYGSLGPGSVGTKMQSVEVAPIPGRTGQKLRNELIFSTTRGGRAHAPAYRLEVAIRESSSSSLVLSDGGSAAQIVLVDARFQLIRLKDKKVLLTGSSQGRANFERYYNVFSNVRAADEAYERAAKVIATDVSTRVSAALAAEA
ncbi:MAG: LPS assembly lipoprotein LptE [Hyphomicrobiaceae bacterium]